MRRVRKNTTPFVPRVQNTTVFVAPSGKMFACLTDMPPSDGSLLYSPDGKTFFALAKGSFSGSSVKCELSFNDPHHGVDGKLHLDGDLITYKGERYVRQDVRFEPYKIVPLPVTRRTRHLCGAKDGTLVYVSYNAYGPYESEKSLNLKLFVGNGTTMREISIRKMTSYIGSTTYIKTSKGLFFSPSPMSPGLVPKWGKLELAKLNWDDYDIVETFDGKVTITKK